MPELPEVETIKNGLLSLVGKKVNQVIIRFPRLRYPLDQKELDKALGQEIIKITRRAKYLIFHLQKGHIIFHLGMSGRLTLYTDAPLLKKHDHVDILCGSCTLRYNDPRRFGCIVFKDNLEESEMIKALGPEPFSAEFNSDYLSSRLKTRNTPIKQLIMDNNIVVGVGNIYASESLFLSKISPLRIGKNVSPKEYEILVSNIRKVLKEAIEAGGSSLRDYKNANGELGYFQQSHNVYGRAKDSCKNCGAIILEIRLGQRNSFYCPSCQS